MKARTAPIQIITLLLMTLWIYTAISKGMDMQVFRGQLLRQPIARGIVDVLVWLLPSTELAAAIFLMFVRTRWAGMLLSFCLMLLFTAYVGLAVAGYWGDIPCSCGGVLNRLGWEEHLWFNLFFTALAGAGIYLLKQQRKDGLQQATLPGEPAKG